MNPYESKKQSFKVIFSEALMFLAVIITVVVLALLVSGYWLNSNFEVERNGMLQISSLPTGANIEIDGKASSWLERTNSSKILSSGEHAVTLSKDGYDTWSKQINISEGLLYRLHYPRLFLNERTSIPAFDAKKYSSATVSATHNSMLLMNDTTSWAYLNLDTTELKPVMLDISSVFSGVSMLEHADAENGEVTVGRFTGQILQANWDYDSSHVLFKVKNGDSIEWVLLDVNDAKKSVNITKEFGADFSRIEILDNNSNNLLAVRGRSLHKIDLPGRLISAILVDNIFDFDHFHNEIIYSTTENVVGYFKIGDTKLTELTSTPAPAKVAISKFYDNKYYTILDGSTVSIYRQDAADEKVAFYELSFSPDHIKVGHDGEFFLFTKDRQIAALDMEAKAVREWTIENDYGWLDNNMLYTINDGSLIVYDYDGLNRRLIADGVSNHFPATIANDKWLYYFKDTELVREIIAD